MATTGKPISSLRWWVAGLLFASTVINYLDRQTLSLLAPFLKLEYHWTNSDYASIAIAFRVAYSIGQTVFGRLMDRIGTRRGLTLTVIWYSIISMLTSLARGFVSFATFRFFLGAGESANWPAATKAVAEWFPKRERALWPRHALTRVRRSAARSLLSLCCSIYFRWGWRPAFMIPGALGFLWLIAWRWLYHPPELHPRISEGELEMIVADKLRVRRCAAVRYDSPAVVGTVEDCGRLGQRSLPKRSADPVFFFITEWFPIYLVAKGIELKSGLIAVWIPFIAADVGSFIAGGCLGSADQARMAAGRGTQGADCFWRNRHDHDHPDDLHD
jgi:MFS transporter, ACS family, hexuronate transporter